METTSTATGRPEVERVQQLLAAQGYVADRAIATAVYLAMKLGKPLLVEGPAGVGKTEIAKVMAQALTTDLIRLQCYEGLDVHTAVYEWNYQRQLLRIRLEEASDRPVEEKEATIFSEAFLLKRPLLQAITHSKAPVLLIDELDRADEEFESFLLEVLSEWQITIPEIGPIRATHVPYVVIPSNQTRDLSDALRRRCLYLWIDYPSFEKELAIVRAKVPGIDERLAREICAFMQFVRRQKLEKAPGIAETLDWAAALVALHRDGLDAATLEETVGLICKQRNDVARLKNQYLPHILARLERLRQEGTSWSQGTIEAVARETEVKPDVAR